MTAKRDTQDGHYNQVTERVLDSWTGGSLEKIRAQKPKTIVYTDARLMEAGALIRSLDGVMILPRDRAPKATPVLE